MTDDLERRLREYRPTNEWGDGVHHVICDEAADEIARLRAENEALREALDELPASAYERGYHDGREDAPSIYHPDVMREGFAQWQADNRTALQEGSRHE